MKFDTNKIDLKGQAFTVVELSARQRQEVYTLFKNDKMDPVELQAHYIKLGCKEFNDKSIDEIMELPGSVFGVLADEIVKISGLADNADGESEKNS